MNSAEVISVLEDAVENDQRLNAWCQSELGKLPNIMIGYDSLKPPTRDSYPIIILFDITPDEEKIRNTTIKRQIAVSCGVLNDSVIKSGRKIKFEGMVQAESFREQISQAILRKFLGKIEINPLGTDSVYPLFASGMTVSVTSTYSMTGE